MKQFNMCAHVGGSQSLLKALAEELEKMGWKYDEAFGDNCNPSSFISTINILSLRDGEFYGQHYDVISPDYILPRDWDKILELAKERRNKFNVGDYVQYKKTPASGNIGRILEINENGTYNVYYELLEDMILNRECDEYDEPISDEEALKALVGYYGEKGIEVGTQVEYSSQHRHVMTISRMELVKNVNMRNRNYGSTLEQGNSGLAIIVGTGKYWITPTTEGFKLKEKELEICGYKVMKENDLIKIGCQSFTLDSIRAIRDILFPEEIQLSYEYREFEKEKEQTFYNGTHRGALKITKEQINEILRIYG